MYRVRGARWIPIRMPQLRQLRQGRPHWGGLQLGAAVDVEPLQCGTAQQLQVRRGQVGRMEKPAVTGGRATHR